MGLYEGKNDVDQADRATEAEPEISEFTVVQPIEAKDDKDRQQLDAISR
jgi:hypothetical protein